MKNGEGISLCTLTVAGKRFGVDVRAVREVLGAPRIHAVPLAPKFVSGMVAYRGDVMSVVSLRALLGEEPLKAFDAAVVLVAEAEGECFGLMVDTVDGVVELEISARRENPPLLNDRDRALFCGAFGTPNGLLVQLHVERLRPEWLKESGMFEAAFPRRGMAETIGGGTRCEL